MCKRKGCENHNFIEISDLEWYDSFIGKECNDRRTGMDGRIRINKYLSEAGICSRRAADAIIAKGLVMVNDVPAQIGQMIGDTDIVRYQNRIVEKQQQNVILAYYKPIGLTCTESRKDPDNIFNYINYPVRLHYVGRLDKDSQGLLLLTNDGELSNRIQKSVNHHEKEYRVRVNRPLTEDFLRQMSEGVPILNTVTKKCRLYKLDNYSFKIVLTQGLNRQIRRMCEYFGYRVVHLKRTRVINIKLGDLKPGEYRVLSGEEEAELRRRVMKSDGQISEEGVKIRNE